MNDVNSDLGPAILTAVDSDDSFEVTSGQSVVIGRGAACDKLIADPELSRKHAKFTFEEGNLVVEDLGSQNGTFVNGKRISQPENLDNDILIAFSKSVYKVSIPQAEIPEPTAQECQVVEAKTQIINAPSGWAIGMTESDESNATSFLDMDHLQSGSGEVSDQNLDVTGPSLICISGKEKSRRFEFTVRDKATVWDVGRRDNCDIVLSSNGVSELHAQITNEGKQWKVSDSMSHNGTFLNGDKVLNAYLGSGDVLQMGECELLFLTGAAPEKPQEIAPRKSSRSKNTSTLVVVGTLSFSLVFILLYIIAKKFNLI